VTPDQAFLGVASSNVSDLPADVRQRFGIEGDDGAFVTEVEDGSGADDADVRVGDLIIEVDGKAVKESEDVRDAVIARKPGDEIKVRVVRDGDEKTLTVTLGRRGDQG
jgi:S1-C subfamily serine protease